MLKNIEKKNKKVKLLLGSILIRLGPEYPLYIQVKTRKRKKTKKNTLPVALLSNDVRGKKRAKMRLFSRNCFIRVSSPLKLRVDTGQ